MSQEKEIEFLQVLDKTLKILGIKIANADRSAFSVALTNSGNLVDLYKITKNLAPQTIAFLLEDEILVGEIINRYNQIKKGKYYSHDESRSKEFGVSKAKIKSEGHLTTPNDLENMPNAKYEDASAIFSDYVVKFILKGITKDKAFLDFIGKKQANPLGFALDQTGILKVIDQFIKVADPILIAGLVRNFNENQGKVIKASYFKQVEIIKASYPKLLSYFTSGELTFAEIERVKDRYSEFTHEEQAKLVKAGFHNVNNLSQKDLVKLVAAIKASKLQDNAPPPSFFAKLVANKVNLSTTAELLTLAKDISSIIGQEATINIINHVVSLQASSALIKLNPDTAIKEEFKIQQIALIDELLKTDHKKLVKLLNNNKETIIPFLGDTLIPYANITFTKDQTVNGVVISKDLLNNVFDNIKANLNVVGNSLSLLNTIITKSDSLKDQEKPFKALKAKLLEADIDKAPKSERSALKTQINELSAKLANPKRELNLAIVGLLKEVTQTLPKNENLVTIIKASVTTKNKAVDGLVEIGAEIFNNMLEGAQLPNILNLTIGYLQNEKPTVKDQIKLVSDIFKEIKQNKGASKQINENLKSYLSANAEQLGKVIEDFANLHPLLKHMNINGERLIKNIGLNCNVDKIVKIMESVEKSKYFSLIFEIGTYAITVACKFIGAKISKFFNDLTKDKQYTNPTIEDVVQIKPGSLLSNPKLSSPMRAQE